MSSPRSCCSAATREAHDEHATEGIKRWPVQLNPYLSFRDNTREVMEFYRTVFGGELTMNTFKEFGGSQRLRAYFDALAAGGRVTMPLQQAIWGDSFGMCVDRFGINWLVNISGSVPQT